MTSEPRLLLVPHGRPARRALWELIDGSKAGDPLHPVTVAVPSPLAGLSLRRGFADGGRTGFANVRFMALARVAELIGSPLLAAAGRRPLTGPSGAHAVRAALEATPGPLHRVRHHTATARAAERSILDLRRAGATARELIALQGTRAAAMVALADRYASLTGAYFDDDDLLDAAVAALGALTPDTPGDATPRGVLADVGTVVLHLPTDLSAAEERLVAALAGAGRAAVILGLTGDDAADRATREIASRLAPALGTAEERPGPGTPHATRLLHAPDPDDEARAVVRQVASLAASRPLHRIAILYRLDDPYARVIHASLDAAGIAWNGPSGQRLADSVAGRVLHGLLDLTGGDLGRDAVSDLLASGPVLDPSDGREVQAHRFDRLSREAGVIRGLDQWTDRLTRLAEERRRVAQDLSERGDDAAGRLRGLEDDLLHAPRIASFIAALHDRLLPPDPPTWPALSAWARRLLDDYLGTDAVTSAWPPDEADAARVVAEMLDGIAALAEIDENADSESFRRAVERELEAPSRRHGQYGRGVFVGQVSQALAADFDTVFVVGLTEGAFPPRGKEDPLIPDSERAAAGSAMPLQAHRRSAERRTFLAALAAADERILSFPRADPRSQRRYLPARWLLESAAALDGRVVGAEALIEHSSGDWLTVVRSFESGITEAFDHRSEPASAEELDLAWLHRWQQTGEPLGSHPLLPLRPTLAAGLASSGARVAHALTAFDGLVGPRPELAPSAESPISATALESWATCPRSYLFSRVLRLSEVMRPEETKTISPIERGSLVHKILEKFIASRQGISLGYRWTESDRAELDGIARDVFTDAEERGITGNRLLWELEQRRIEKVLDAFLAIDEGRRAQRGVSPSCAEMSFGLSGVPPVTTALDDRRTISFKGRIDRVDTSPDGSLALVYDYKTGSDKKYTNLEKDAVSTGKDPFDGGRLLQLPVYALAVERDHPGALLESYYWFLENAQETAFRGYA